MAGIERKGGRKNRKHGRNKAKCERYRAAGRREKNKAVRIARCEARTLSEGDPRGRAYKRERMLEAERLRLGFDLSGIRAVRREKMAA